MGSGGSKKGTPEDNRLAIAGAGWENFNQHEKSYKPKPSKQVLEIYMTNVSLEMAFLHSYMTDSLGLMSMSLKMKDGQKVDSSGTVDLLSTS